MIFKARVHIQGVGTYVLGEETGQRNLQVFFPRQDATPELLNSKREAICRHYMVVQFSARNLDPKQPDQWITIFAQGYEISFESDSKMPFDHSRWEPGEDGNVPEGIKGLPNLDEVLKKAEVKQPVPIRPTVVSRQELDQLSAILRIDQGTLGPDTRFMGSWKLVEAGASENKPAEGTSGPRTREAARSYSSVMRVEYGEVDHFELVLRPLHMGGEQRIALQPMVGYLDVWVRHHCEALTRPDPERDPGTEREDLDFTLNYALSGHVQEFHAAPFGTGAKRMWVPQIVSSWKEGNSIGGDLCQCMGCNGSGGKPPSGEK